MSDIPAPVAPPPAAPTAEKSEKSKLAYILLGIFLGCFGIHNFYAGETGKGVAKLLITVLSLGFLSLGVWIWMIVEICTTTKDAKGLPFS